MSSASRTLTPIRLRCEYLDNPLGIDTELPRLSWALASEAPRQRQTAYRIIVSSSPDAPARGDGDLWDTGRVSSARTLHIVYAGISVPAFTRVWWRIEVWDRDGLPGTPSEPAWWETAFTDREGWEARWVTGKGEAPLLSCYPKRAFCDTYNVTALRIVYRDGSVSRIETGPGWSTSPSGLVPVPSHSTFCFGFGGELFDLL